MLKLLLILSLVNPLPLAAQDPQSRILVPEEQKKTAAKKDDGPRAPRPELVLQTGVTVPATNIAFSPDGRLLASIGLQAGAIKLWETATGRELYNLNLGARGSTTTSLNSAFIFSPDGKRILSSSAGVIREWDAQTGKQMRATALLSKGQDFGGVAFSPDGRFLATTPQSKVGLTIWDVATGRAAQQIRPTDDSGPYLHAFAFSPDARLLATAEEMRGADGDIQTLVLREAATGRILQTIRLSEQKFGRAAVNRAIKSSMPVREIHFSLDGRAVAMVIRDTLYEQTPGSFGGPQPTGQENIVRLWETASGRELRSVTVADAHLNVPVKALPDYTGGRSLAFTSDGRLMAAIGNDQMVKLYEVASGRQVATISGHEGEILAVTFSGDNLQAATSGTDNSIRIWDISSAATTGRATIVRTFSGGALTVSDLAYGGDGRTLAVGAPQAVSLWDFSTGAALRTAELATRAPRRLIDIFDDRPQIFFSAGGQFVAASSGSGEMKILETRSGREVRTIRRQSDKPMMGGDLSPDGRTLAIADAVSARAQATSPATSTPPAQIAIPYPAPSNTSRDQSGQKKDDRKDDRKADKDEKKRQQQLEKQQREAMKQMEKMAKSGQIPQMMNIDLSQMQKAAEAAQRGEFGRMQEIMGQMYGGALSNLPGAAPPTGVRIVDVNAGSEMRAIPGSAALGAGNRATVAFSQDGRLLAAATTGHQIGVHDLASGREILRLAANRGFLVDQIAFSPDGRLLAAAMMETRAGIDLTAMTADMNMSSIYTFVLRVWDISNPSARAREMHSLTGHASSITALAFSPDGKRLASGGYDAQVKLWDVSAGREMQSFAGHTLGVTALAFSPDGRLLASGGEDGGARLWEVETGEPVATLITLNRGADWLVVTPDGLFDGTPGAWNQILWRFSSSIYDVTPVEVFFNEFYSPGLLSAIYSGARPRATAEIAARDRRQPVVRLARADGAAAEVSSRTIKVRVEVSEPPTDGRTDGREAVPAGARDVRLFRNGTLVKVWRGDQLKGARQAVLEAEIPVVAGENRLTAYAFNRDNIKSADAALTVIGDASLKREATAWVLAVGVNRYANEQYNLKYAVADATAFAEEFRAQQAKLKQYARTEVITLTDAEATKENLIAALKALAGTATGRLAPGLERLRRAEPEDAVVIYFAGHGTARGARFYLVPHDLGYTGSRTEINAAAIETILSRSVSDLELEAAVEGLDAERLLLVIDACNSGQALEAEEKRRGPMNSKGLAQLAYEKGMYILTAAQSYQAALEAAELGHGYLTYTLVEEGIKKGLADRDEKDGQVMVREWFDYASERVPQMQEQGIRSRLLLFVEGEEKIKDPARRSVQRPRVFYRRELDARPFIVAKP